MDNEVRVLTFALLLCYLGTAADSAPGRTVYPALDRRNFTRQADSASLQLERALRRQRPMQVSLRTGRQAACNREAFLEGQGGTCADDAAVIASDDSSASSRENAWRRFCESCVEDFTEYLEGVCDQREDAESLRERCAEGPDEQFCAVLFIRAEQLSVDPLRTCNDLDNLFDCSSRCKESLEGLRDDYGCCLDLANEERIERLSVPDGLYKSCDVSIPKRCNESEEEESSALTLALILALVGAVLTSTSVFVISCVIYCCCCRNNELPKY